MVIDAGSGSLQSDWIQAAHASRGQAFCVVCVAQCAQPIPYPWEYKGAENSSFLSFFEPFFRIPPALVLNGFPHWVVQLRLCCSATK